MAEGGERVGAEVGGLETGGAGAGDVETVLEVFIQGVEEAVGEALGGEGRLAGVREFRGLDSDSVLVSLRQGGWYGL